jgi:hypothetical protein
MGSQTDFGALLMFRGRSSECKCTHAQIIFKINRPGDFVSMDELLHASNRSTERKEFGYEVRESLEPANVQRGCWSKEGRRGGWMVSSLGSTGSSYRQGRFGRARSRLLAASGVPGPRRHIIIPELATGRGNHTLRLSRACTRTRPRQIDRHPAKCEAPGVRSGSGPRIFRASATNAVTFGLIRANATDSQPG